MAAVFVIFGCSPIFMPAAVIILSTIKKKFSFGTIIFEVPVVMIAYGCPSLKVKELSQFGLFPGFSPKLIPCKKVDQKKS